MPSYVHIPVSELEAFITHIFATAGCGSREAARIASHLVGANLAGMTATASCGCRATSSGTRLAMSSRASRPRW
jgi:LDH2 family malate/lactate/ureidoglycolate dehydrogenase